MSGGLARNREAAGTRTSYNPRRLQGGSMRPLLVTLALCIAMPAFAQQVPEIPFDSTSVLQLPEGMYLGEVAGVALNSKKHIFVFHRGNVSGPAFGALAAQLLEFGPDGKFIREIGKGMYAMAY